MEWEAGVGGRRSVACRIISKCARMVSDRMEEGNPRWMSSSVREVATRNGFSWDRGSCLMREVVIGRNVVTWDGMLEIVEDVQCARVQDVVVSVYRLLHSGQVYLRVWRLCRMASK